MALASNDPIGTPASEAEVIAGQQTVIDADPNVFAGAGTNDFDTERALPKIGYSFKGTSVRVGAAWMEETTRVAPDILANCPPEQWQYGHGILTNAEGRVWPDLPREAITSSGAGGRGKDLYHNPAVREDAPWRLQQIQDAANHLQLAMNALG